MTTITAATKAVGEPTMADKYFATLVNALVGIVYSSL
jgi:hypothetical protein